MKKTVTTIVFLIILLAGAGAQEIHKLEKFNIEIDGKTREKALINEMTLKAGSEFPDKASLEQALYRQEQDLINLRVFNTISMTLSEGNKVKDTVLYTVDVKVEDSWTIYPIPYPKYNSNDGFRLGLKIFYDNALGSLNNFYLGTNITFKYDREDQKWINSEWTINPQLNAVKIGKLDYDFGFMQQKSYTEKKDGDVYLEKYTYYNTAANVRTTFNFGPENKYFYQVNPGIGMNYAYSGTGYQGNQEPYYLSFNHGGGFSKVDWKGNFREGFTVTAGNTLRYVHRNDSADQFKVYLDGQTSFFKILNPRMNYSTRLSGVISFMDDMNSLGVNLRGVEDSTMYGTNGLFLNNDMNFSVIQWKGVGEAQFQPFFDIGLARRKNEALHMDRDLRYSTGADFILYLDKLKGLHARASIGVDLSSDLPFSDLGKYGIDISSSLQY